MKVYEKTPFLKIDPKRQMKICLDCIYAVEKEKTLISSVLKKLLDYFSWIEESSEGASLLKDLRITHLLPSLKAEPSLQKLLSLATAIERWLLISVSDEQIIVSSLDKRNKVFDKKPLFVVLDNLRSAFNVGSIFRTAECLGISHIYLVGYTPTPEDVPVKKTAMGTEKLVSWSKVNKIDDLISDFKSRGVKMVAMETSSESVDLYKAKVKSELALFLGNERFGLNSLVLKQMDQIIEIPMAGVKNSLNVSNAFAIGASEILRSWKEL